MKVTRKNERCFEGVLMVFQGSFKGVFENFTEEEVSRMFNGVS